MATIRIPSSAGEILAFCATHPDSHKLTCFANYAHMLVAAAGIGFHKGGNARSIPCRSFLNQPGAIDLAIFRSQGLMPQMLALGVVCLSSPDDATDDTEIARLIEDLAEEGLMEMERLVQKDGVASFSWKLAEWIAAPPSIDSGII